MGLLLHANGQRLPDNQIQQINLQTSVLNERFVSNALGRSLSFAGGEFALGHHKYIGFDAFTASMLEAETNLVQKSTISLSGFNVLVYKISNLSTRVYVSQGFTMRQQVEKSPGREWVNYEGLSPIFSFALGMEYKLGKHTRLFSKFRWAGGDKTNQDTQAARNGLFLFQTGISCKFVQPKKQHKPA